MPSFPQAWDRTPAQGNKRACEEGDRESKKASADEDLE